MNSSFDTQTAISQIKAKVLFCSFLRKIIICTSTRVVSSNGNNERLSDCKSAGKKHNKPINFHTRWKKSTVSEANKRVCTGYMERKKVQPRDIQICPIPPPIWANRVDKLFSNPTLQKQFANYLQLQVKRLSLFLYIDTSFKGIIGAFSMCLSQVLLYFSRVFW